VRTWRRVLGLGRDVRVWDWVGEWATLYARLPSSLYFKRFWLEKTHALRAESVWSPPPPLARRVVAVRCHRMIAGGGGFAPN